MTLDTVRRTFTAWAPFYDATHAWPLPLRREARLALGVQRGERVLDVACGTGLNFSHLRELVGEEGYVLGVDVTPAMLDIARQRSGSRGVVGRTLKCARWMRRSCRFPTLRAAKPFARSR